MLTPDPAHASLQLTVTASNGAFTASTAVYVYLTDVNDNPPQMTNLPANISLSEVGYTISDHTPTISGHSHHLSLIVHYSWYASIHCDCYWKGSGIFPNLYYCQFKCDFLCYWPLCVQRLYIVTDWSCNMHSKKKDANNFDSTSDLLFHICTKTVIIWVQIWNNRSLVKSKYDLRLFFCCVTSALWCNAQEFKFKFLSVKSNMGSKKGHWPAALLRLIKRESLCPSAFEWCLELD